MWRRAFSILLKTSMKVIFHSRASLPVNPMASREKPSRVILYFGCFRPLTTPYILVGNQFKIKPVESTNQSRIGLIGFFCIFEVFYRSEDMRMLLPKLLRHLQRVHVQIPVNFLQADAHVLHQVTHHCSFFSLSYLCIFCPHAVALSMSCAMSSP